MLESLALENFVLCNCTCTVYDFAGESISKAATRILCFGATYLCQSIYDQKFQGLQLYDYCCYFRSKLFMKCNSHLQFSLVN